MKETSNQLNLTIIAVVALVAIVGLVALVMNAATIAEVPLGSQSVAAQPTTQAAPAAQNTAGSAIATFDAACYKTCMASHSGQESTFMPICRRDCMTGGSQGSAKNLAGGAYTEVEVSYMAACVGAGFTFRECQGYWNN